MKLRHLACASLLPFCLPAVAMAQQADPETAREDEDVIVVTATGLSEAFSSTKTDTPLIETPQSISLITREEMDIRGVHTVAEALSYSAGIQAEASGIDSRVDEVSVRGFGAGGFSSNNNFVDGLRLPTGGQWTRPAFDPFGLQQVEVLKGPSSVLYGQVAPGGIVNLVSKRPTDQPTGEIMFQTAGFTELEHWQHQIAGDVSGPLGETGSDVQYRLVGLYRDGETQIDETENSRLYLSPSLNWDIGPDTSVTFLVQYQKDEGGSTFQFLPSTGSLYESNGRHIELDAYIGEPDWNRFDRDQYLAAAFFEHNVSDNLTYNANVRYTHIESLYRVVVLAGDTVTNCGSDPLCIPGQTINRRAVQGIGETDGWAIDNRLQYAFATGALEHTLLAGFDYFNTEWTHNRDAVGGGAVLPLYDIYNPQPRGSADFEANLRPQIYTDTTSEQTGIYLQDQIAVGNWRWALGGRHDTATDDSYDPLTDTTRSTEADEFTWQTGLIYLFDNGFAPYASYSESFLPSTGNYWDGTPFDPTTGQQYEAGLRYQPSGSNIFLTLSAYEIIQQNVTTTDPDPTHDCGRRPCSVQTGEAEVRGIEAEARATLPFGMAVIATATSTESEITETNTPAELGNELSGVPDMMASLFVDYRFDEGALDGFGLGGGVRYVGESYGDTANTLEIPSYTLVDLMGRYEFGALNPDWDGWVASVNARNIANEAYVATCTSVSSCFYGSGRTVNLRLQYRW